MNSQKISRLTTGLLAAVALMVAGTSAAMAQMSHHMKHSQSYYRHHYSSNVQVGGSWASQSAYNNHQHHTLASHRKYYTYNGNQYYIDLDTGIRFQI